MRNSTIKPSREMIAEASAWLIEFRTEDPDQAQRDRFNVWLCASPQHIQAYFEVAAAWSELPDEDPEGRIGVEQMIRAARATDDANIIELGARFQVANAKPRTRFPLKLTAIAACVLALFLSAAAYLYFQRGIYETQTGEQRSLTLADGSTVDLNAQSKIRVRYTDDERLIDLVKGQALFHVARNTTRPFIVDTGDTQVRAVGTQFDVYRKGSATIVTVVEGQVAVTAPRAHRSSVQSRSPRPRDGNPNGESAAVLAATEAADTGRPEAQPMPVMLAAGEQLAIESTAVTRLEHPDIEAATAWTQKRLVFEDTPLSEVAAEFNRYNVRRLVIVDRGLQHIGVSGLYSSTDPTALIAFLHTQPGILVTETDAEIRITRKQN